MRTTLEKFVSSNWCTPGAYRLVGTKGTRIGESKCLEERLPDAIREHKHCIGRVKKVEIMVESRRRRRLQIQRQAILRAWASGIRSCNRVLR